MAVQGRELDRRATLRRRRLAAFCAQPSPRPTSDGQGIQVLKYSVVHSRHFLDSPTEPPLINISPHSHLRTVPACTRAHATVRRSVILLQADRTIAPILESKSSSQCPRHCQHCCSPKSKPSNLSKFSPAT